MKKHFENAPHILNTSSNLLGLCFIVLTSIKALHLSESTIIDSFTAVATLFFMTSSFMAFLAMRSKSGYSERYEKIAEYVFLGGLLSLFLTTMLMILDLIK